MRWTMGMAWLCLPAYTVLLVGCFHAAVTEKDVTPRLTFSHSKFFFFINFDYRVTMTPQSCRCTVYISISPACKVADSAGYYQSLTEG